MGTGARIKHMQQRRAYLVLLLVFIGAAFVACIQSARHTNESARCGLQSHPVDATELDLKDCGLDSLPADIIKFVNLKKLDLANNNLTTLPRLPSSLEILFLLNNAFTTIPPSIERMPRLRMLSFKGCKLQTIGKLPPSLVWLILTGNQLVELPKHLGQLVRVRKLMLSNNRLISLPSTLRRLRELELLRIANNKLTHIPEWIFDLPKLSWLAVAGNPAIAPAPPRNSLADIRFDDVILGEKLGEGTSSVVVRAEWRGQMVAAKLYKSEFSSDGRNIDEVRASCAVDHPNILHFLGYYTTPSLGALLEWQPNLRSLGKPPSLQSVTRDTYNEGVRFSEPFIFRLALSIARAAAHMHANGLSHGDLYAHNILVDHRSGIAKLADFGAAFFYGGPSAPHAVQYQAMETRAYGLLLEEMLERHDGLQQGRLTVVRSLASACKNSSPERRPRFEVVVSTLEAAENDVAGS